MAKVLGTKKTERAGVNAFKSTLEAAGHIVQEIDGGNDYGEDCYLSFTELGRRTGDLAAVQVKSGVKYRRAIGYAIPCREHAEDWLRSRIPVIGVVYDPEMRACYWVNITAYLRCETSKGKKPKSVPVAEDALLEGNGVDSMVKAVRQYIAETLGPNTELYPGVRGAIKKVLDEHQHKKEKHLAAAPVGGHPMPEAKVEADFLDRHPNFLPRAISTLFYLITIAVHAAMTPGLYEAAGDEHGHIMRLIWLACFYGLIWYLLITGRRDSHGGRAAALRCSAYLLVCLGWYVAMGRMGPSAPWPVPKPVEEIFIITIPQVAKFAVFLIGAHYLRLEFARRRRVAKLQPSESGGSE
jgi:hypothetical protein